jgi:hypothetical protein
MISVTGAALARPPASLYEELDLAALAARYGADLPVAELMKRCALADCGIR